MGKFLKIYESIIGDTAYHNAVLKDVQIGDVYIKLVKDTMGFYVEKGKGPTPNKVKFKKVFSTKSEERGRKYFEKLRTKVIDKLGAKKNGNGTG